MLRLLLPLILLAVCCTQAPAQAAEGAPIQAIQLQDNERIVLDGTLSHPAWQRAPVHDQFIEKDPVNGTAPTHRTSVQVLFDQQALYVGIHADEAAPERIRAPFVRNDNVIRTQDFVVLYLDAIGRRGSAQFFRVSASGSTGDGLHTAADDNEDFAPDFDWDAATARTATGWSAVLRIPFSSLRFAPGQQGWRMMVARRLPREQFHLFASTPIPRDAPNFIATMQPLLGIELPARQSFLTLRPSLTLRSEKIDGVSTRKADASLDMKWRPRAELLVDATLNPDFSQVALDVPQLRGNSGFALSLAEKRPFFFESADLLRSPTDAFYTRSFTQPRWGLRSTWRGAAFAGSAFALDDRGGGQVLLPGAFGTDAARQPGSRALAARARFSADEALGLGALAVSRVYERHAGRNDVVGPDVEAALGAGWRARGQWLYSRTTAWPGAGSGGALTESAARDGQRRYLALLRNTGLGETTLRIDDTDAQFRHDSGFVAQAGTRRIEAFQSFGWEGVGPLNQLFVNTQFVDVRERSSGQIASQFVRPGLYYNGPSNLEGWFEVFVRSRVRTARDAALLDERFISTGFSVTPAVWFPLLEARVDHGRFADRGANRIRPGTNWGLSAKLRPLASLEIEPRIDAALLRADAGEGASRAYDERAVQVLAVWHFDARHTLRAIQQDSRLQRPASNLDARRHTSSLTYAWRQSAGTRLYIGATRLRAPGDAPARATEVFIKLQFDGEELFGHTS